MNNSGLIKKMVPIYLASFIAWFHYIVYTPLGYIYNTYPGKESLVMLIAVLPGIAATAGGFLAGKFMELLGRKKLVLLSMVLMLVGSMGMFLLGEQGIWLAIVFSGISGIGAGTIPAVNYVTLAEIAPENLRDKVCGWSDSVCSLGLAFAIFTCGMLASDGVWTRGYAVYFTLIPILLLSMIWYPKDAALTPAADAGTASGETAPETEKNVLPGCIIVLLVVKLVCGLFNNCFGVFGSDFIINEVQLGSSAMVGSVNTLTQIMGVLIAAVIFLWLKYFKGASTIISQLVVGGFTLAMVLVKPSVSAIVICAALGFIGNISSHSSLSTIMAMAPKGKAVGTATGIFLGMTFIGESFGGYVVPFVAKIFLGSSSASSCLKIGGIICIIVGVISLPFFQKAYKLAFPKEKASKSNV